MTSHQTNKNKIASVSIKRAKIQDAKALIKAQIEAFHHDSVLYPEIEVGGPPGYDSIDVMREKITDNETYKIMSDKQLIGGIVIFNKGNGHYHLDLIFIVPEFHNRGIGTKAMRFIEDTFSATKWTLDTPAWAVRNIHFYEKLGYVKVDEFEDDGTPLIVYEKHIPKAE